MWQALALAVEFNSIIVLQAKKKHSLNQEDDPNSQKVLDRKIKEVKINKEALIGSDGAEASVARNIPPYVANATTPQEAYPLDKIILMGEWDYIADIFELLQEKPKLASNAYPTFVSNRIDKLQGIQVWSIFANTFMEEDALLMVITLLLTNSLLSICIYLFKTKGISLLSNSRECQLLPIST